MMRIERIVALAGTLLAAGVGSARAHPWCEGGPPEQAAGRFGVGLHHTSQAIETGEATDEREHLGGGGVHLRFRFLPRWSAEVGMDHLRSKDDDRELRSTSLSLAFHPLPGRRVDFYLLAGGGRRDDRRQAQVGVGLEKRFRHLGIGVEARMIALEDEDPPEMQVRSSTTTTGSEREHTHGGQVTLGLTWYFGR